MSFAKVVKRPEEYDYYVLTVIVYKHISSIFSWEIELYLY